MHNLTPLDKLERIVFILACVVVALDLYYWRP
jgi:hypothetical protein